MEVFWAKGYEAASLTDLVGAMGISKSSFYDTYGSKHDLLLSALDHYNKTIGCRVTDLVLDHPQGPKAGIAAALNGVVNQNVEGDSRRGCLTSNCTVELAPHDPAVAAKVQDSRDHLEAAFYEAVRMGQDSNEIPRRSDARALAHFLTCSVNGLTVMAKSGADRAALEDAVRIALSTLD